MTPASSSEVAIRSGELTLHEAVDVLQHWAAQFLIPPLTQDEVQRIMSEAFAKRRIWV